MSNTTHNIASDMTINVTKHRLTSSIFLRNSNGLNDENVDEPYDETLKKWRLQ